MMPMRLVIVYMVFCVVWAGVALDGWAQKGGVSASANHGGPLEIEADETLEWHRDARKFVARGNVVVTQGDVRLYADMVSADYREDGDTSMEIYQLTAEGSVKIVSQGNIATGDHAVYAVDTGLAIMTGHDLSLQAQDHVVTARDRFEYHVTDGLLKAVGDMKATRGADMLQADEGYARFTQDGTGKRQLLKLEASGNVVITTAAEVLRGQRGVYIAATNIAELIGNVTITRGPNILAGERAEVNLTSNISKIHGGEASQGGEGRVRGVFYPGSQKNEENRNSGAIMQQVTPAADHPQEGHLQKDYGADDAPLHRPLLTR